MKTALYCAIAATTLLLAACGDDGNNGVNGINGADGLNGSNGINTLVKQTKLDVGNEHCKNGGVQIDSGLDSDTNGDLSASEITTTEFVCSPSVTRLSQSDLLNSLNNPWFAKAAKRVESTDDLVAQMTTAKGKAKNVILFVGDGMGVSTVTAARILDGQQKGLSGEENVLSFGAFPFTGLSKTYNVDAQTPDSAGTMTAMMSGVKTDVGVIGVDEDIVRGDCTTVAGNELVSALELAELAGMSTGVISTARITHATPAATYAKSADRNWEDDGDMPQAAKDAGCKDIALQLIEFEQGLETRYPGYDVDGIEVVMGGGRRSFLPKNAIYNSGDNVSAVEGDRTDSVDRNLPAEWQVQYPNGVYVIDQSGFDSIDPNNTERVLGLFNESHMQYEADRGNDILGEPSISEMTAKAIDILDNNDKGFFLMVEAGRIDHAHHAGNAAGALTDTIALAEAVQAAVDNTDPDETLILVTADHSHVFTIAGYPKRGNPILGKVVNIGATDAALAADGLPYTTLGYMNGFGFKDLGAETDSDAIYAFAPDAGRKDLSNVDTTAPGYHQEALIPLGSETHAGEDVGIYATGPGAQLVTGTNEQSIIFHVMNYAAGLVDKAEQ